MANIPGLGDRAAMEKERLARQAARGASAGVKREREITPPPLARPTKVARLKNDPERNGVMKTQGPEVVDLTFDSPDGEGVGQGQKSSQSTSSTQRLSQTASASTTLQYPNGVIKRTWAFGHARTGNDIKIEEVLEKSTLRIGVLSAFQWDTEWILSKINMAQSKLIFVMQAKEQALRDQMLKETEDMRQSLRLCFPPMDGQINCMHSKLMLLFHPTKLRVAVPSANLTNYDWGETSIMENSVFLIDLPRLPEGGKAIQTDLTPFAEELLHFLEKQGLDDDIREGLLKFDFSSTEHLAFVHTSGGASYGEEMQRTGFMGLNKAVNTLGLCTEADTQVDFVASSIGSLNDDILRVLHTAARGEASSYLAPKTSTKKSSQASSSTTTNVRDRFRIYFPTLETVAASTGGVNNGGTICLQRKWWEGNNDFPRPCFLDYQSIRTGLLSHNKILYARGHAKEGGGDVAWAYTGSANMSESAWGKLVWDAKRKEWKINCRNWECGVIMRVPEEKLVKDDNGKKDAAADNTGKVVQMKSFEDVVGVPFHHPGRDFGNREPWYFTEPH